MRQRLRRVHCGAAAGLLVVLLILTAATASADEIDDRVDRLNVLLKDLETVVAERRADQVVVTGWTRDKHERSVVSTILKTDGGALDLTSSDVDYANEMIEIDVVIVVVSDVFERSVGFDFLNLVTVGFEYFAADHKREGSGFQAPERTGTVDEGTQWGTLFDAKVSYNVEIANATDELVDIVARPHLTTLNGQKAEFLAGGEFVFKVSGINTGRIQPYPFGINLEVTPTILRTRGPDNQKQVLLDVKASRLSVLGVRFADEAAGADNVEFDKTEVKSKALLPMNETLILSGIYQKEHREMHTGVPILRNIPFIKYFFSNRSNLEHVLSTVVFLTPREPGILNDSAQQELDSFIERRLAYVRAREEGGETAEQFKKENPSWYRPQANRYASHFFLYNNSRVFRELRGEDLRSVGLRRDIMTVESADEAWRKRKATKRE